MNKRQFIAKLKKELNSIFNHEIEVEIGKDENGVIVVSFWKNGLLGFYTIDSIEYNDEYLQKQVGIAKIIHDGYLLGRTVERKMTIDKLKTILTEYDRKVKE